MALLVSGGGEGKAKRLTAMALSVRAWLCILLLLCVRLLVLVYDNAALPPPTKLERNGARPVLVYRNATNHIDACVIPDACFTNRPWERVLYVPESYRRLEALLRACRKYNNTFPYVQLQFYDIRAPLSKTQHPVDALGVPFSTEWYTHFAHFAREFVESALVPTALFLRQTPVQDPTCFYPANDDASARRCNSRAIADLDPRLVFSAKTIAAGTRWSSHLLRFLLGPRFPHSTYLAPNLDAEEGNVACFRSIVTSPQDFDSADSDRDVLFRHAGVTRVRRVPRSGGRCALHIVILVRDSDASLRIIQPSVMLRYVSILGQRVPDASVELVADLGNRTFGEQVELMQRADIVVTVHGAELSNALFLASGARVIEIFPFGYVNHFVGYFAPLYRGVHAHRAVVVGRPDMAGFSKCMKKRFKKLDSGWTFYKKQAELFRKSSSDDERYRAANFWMNRFGERICLRQQAILVDAEQLANVTVREARKLC